MSKPVIPLTVRTDRFQRYRGRAKAVFEQQKLLSFRVTAGGGVMNDKPFTVPLKGDGAASPVNRWCR